MRIRFYVVACLAAAACSHADATHADHPAISNQATLDVPRVDDDRAVADPATLAHPAAVVWVDAHGGYQVATVASASAWTTTLASGSGRLAATTLGDALALLGEDVATRQHAATDDPPPPPEEDRPDDGSDESGGTGTAMALDEGKMGHKDSDRGGQSNVKNAGSDPQLARQQAIDQARTAGILGSVDGEPLAGSLASLPVAELTEHAIVVAAAPNAPALALVRIVDAESGAIAVAHHDTLAVLGRGYGISSTSVAATGAWLELHVTADALHVVETSMHDQTVVAWKQGTVDRDALAATYTRLRRERFPNADPTLQVRVGDGVTAQQLVDVLTALDALGATRTTLGELAGTTDARLAELARHTTPTVSVGQPSANGDLDKKIIRGVIKANIAAITACYERQLLNKPGLAGTVSAQFFIDPRGVVTNASAAGVDPDVASCVAGVIKNITFPKPKGGGGVQVNYPFTFRPSTP